MNAILKLVQGSPEWHAHRAQYRNASESAAVMGASPWMTPYQFWQIRTGRVEQTVTTAMQHGTDMEPRARVAYEAQTGLIMQPLVLSEGDYSASLDGITLEGDLLLEVKCPYKGQSSALWQSASTGEVPEYYRIQIQHQLMVAGAAMAHLWVFDGTEGLLLEVGRDEIVMEAIRAAWDSFQQYLDNDTPPPLTVRDTATRDDPVWKLAAVFYLNAKRKAEEATATLETARERLVALASHPSESGAGVTVTRFWKQGNVDYKRVPELKGVDLDQYRGKGREEVRVTIVK
ncbi:MAG: YqaJ viral recombinase family protein [Gammaproteobacteria bacterium]|nr:YqaJ viral recombinase family protein [Gammaproteobacteria bacterium]MBU1732636.1 YqaJ viral recombinase family protein [Gammaproteobacteria bacterium]MBU1893499.1 YqaJ viral recombinase family protein [Gammaproteobacteria bacterium]